LALAPTRSRYGSSDQFRGVFPAERFDLLDPLFLLRLVEPGRRRRAARQRIADLGAPGCRWNLQAFGGFMMQTAEFLEGSAILEDGFMSRRILGLAAATFICASCGPALADQSGAVTGGVAGAVGGAVIGGPVGAVVGGVGGAAIGNAVTNHRYYHHHYAYYHHYYHPYNQ
jgi:hypothetical protein